MAGHFSIPMKKTVLIIPAVLVAVTGFHFLSKPQQVLDAESVAPQSAAVGSIERTGQESAMTEDSKKIAIAAALPQTTSNSEEQRVPMGTQSTGDMNLAEFSRQWGAVLGKASASLSFVRDEHSANSAAPVLRDALASVKNLSSGYSTLPVAAKPVMTNMITERLAGLTSQSEAIYSQQDKATANALRPIMAPLLEALAALQN